MVLNQFDILGIVISMAQNLESGMGISGLKQWMS